MPKRKSPSANTFMKARNAATSCVGLTTRYLPLLAGAYELCLRQRECDAGFFDAWKNMQQQIDEKENTANSLIDPVNEYLLHARASAAWGPVLLPFRVYELSTVHDTACSTAHEAAVVLVVCITLQIEGFLFHAGFDEKPSLLPSRKRFFQDWIKFHADFNDSLLDAQIRLESARAMEMFCDELPTIGDESKDRYARRRGRPATPDDVKTARLKRIRAFVQPRKAERWTESKITAAWCREYPSDRLGRSQLFKLYRESLPEE